MSEVGVVVVIVL